MPSVNAKLRAIRSRFPAMADIDEINKQIDAEQNDRGAAILAATLIDNILRYVIIKRIPGSQ
jgi:hypothetical protein